MQAKWCARQSLLMLIATPAMMAQLTTATFYGIVTDPSGAVVPGVTATMTNEGTSSAQTKSSDAQGEFVFDFLRVGVYKLRLEAKGFKTSEISGIELAAAQNVRRTFALELGGVTETVQVEGGAPLVNTVSAEQRESISKLEVTELPLSRRNFTALLQIGTGVTGGGGVLRLNGAVKSGTLFTVDGTDATADPESRTTSMRGDFHYINTVSIEAVQEVQTVKGVVPAEYGQVVGGNVNLITKSGTNNWHGTLFENFQAEDLNARNQFLVTKVPVTFNQFGGSAGGPIKRDRIFVFGAYEGYREAAFQLVNGNVPTQKLRDEMIGAVPAYKHALDQLPLPTEPHAPAADVGFYNSAGKARTSDNHAVVKGDIRVTEASNLALTYTRGRPYRLTPNIAVSNNRLFEGIQERGTLSYVMGGAAWSSETRFGYALADMARLDEFFLDGIPEETPFGGRTPQISSSLGFNTPGTELWLVEGPIWSLEQKYARHMGRHSVKLGGKFVRYTGGRTNPENPSIYFEGKPDLLANIPSRIQNTFGNGLYNGNNFEVGFFVQDDWRVNRKLVINLGLRYDFYSHLVVESRAEGVEYGFYNLDGLLDDKFTFGPPRDPDNPYESDGWVNLGPRVGFSYNPDGNGKTVIRGGFGVLFSPHMQGMLKQAVGSPTVPFRYIFSKVEAQQYNLRFPTYNDTSRRVLETLGRPAVFSVFNPQLQNPYTMNFYLGIQRELTGTLMFETAVVSNRGVKYPLHRLFNQADRVTGLRPNPSLGEGFYADNSQQTFYASWQTSLRKRYSSNLIGSMHYTWGKALATENGDIGAYYQGNADVRVQNFFDLRSERGPADGDITHYFAADWVYDLPRFQNQKSFVKHLLGDWQVTGIFTAATGEPLLIVQGPVRNTTRPDYVGGPAVLSDYRKTLQYLNRAAFAAVPVNPVSGRTIRPGNIGSGAVRNAGRWNVDASIGKNFRITEAVKLNFRLDGFNFFNHTNLSGFSADFNNARFGKFTSARGARVLQLAARLSW